MAFRNSYYLNTPLGLIVKFAQVETDQSTVTTKSRLIKVWQFQNPVQTITGYAQAAYTITAASGQNTRRISSSFGIYLDRICPDEMVDGHIDRLAAHSGSSGGAEQG